MGKEEQVVREVGGSWSLRGLCCPSSTRLSWILVSEVMMGLTGMETCVGVKLDLNEPVVRIGSVSGMVNEESLSGSLRSQRTQSPFWSRIGSFGEVLGLDPFLSSIGVKTFRWKGPNE